MRSLLLALPLVAVGCDFARYSPPPDLTIPVIALSDLATARDLAAPAAADLTTSTDGGAADQGARTDGAADQASPTDGSPDQASPTDGRAGDQGD
jgi:hypothetical protein